PWFPCSEHRGHMDAKDVAQFLNSNPQFFDQNPQLLESIYVPHPHGGRAIPLTERQIISVPHVALKLWTDDDVAAELRDKAGSMGAPLCGPAAGNPFLPWFQEAQDHIRSIALVPLGQTATIGLLALGSEDPQRFFPEMGTLYLRRIGELTAGALAGRK